MRERRIRRLGGHPKPNQQYILGADPSGGTGNDDAAVIVICVDSLEQVYAFNDNTTNPVEFGYLLSKVGKEYNEAYIVCEGNNHGLSVHPILVREYNKMRVFKRTLNTAQGVLNKYGFLTTENSKRALVGAVTDVMDFGLTLYDRETVDALLSFEENEKGKMGGPGDHLVIALGLCCFGVLKKGGVHLAQTQLPDRETHKEKMLRLFNGDQMQFRADDVLNELQELGRNQLGRFKRQVSLR